MIVIAKAGCLSGLSFLCVCVFPTRQEKDAVSRNHLSEKRQFDDENGWRKNVKDRTSKQVGKMATRRRWRTASSSAQHTVSWHGRALADSFISSSLVSHDLAQVFLCEESDGPVLSFKSLRGSMESMTK